MFEQFNHAFLNGESLVIVLAHDIQVSEETAISRLILNKDTVDSVEVAENGILVTKGKDMEYISMNQVFSISMRPTTS